MDQWVKWLEPGVAVMSLLTGAVAVVAALAAGRQESRLWTAEARWRSILEAEKAGLLPEHMRQHVIRLHQQTTALLVSHHRLGRFSGGPASWVLLLLVSVSVPPWLGWSVARVVVEEYGGNVRSFTQKVLAGPLEGLQVPIVMIVVILVWTVAWAVPANALLQRSVLRYHNARQVIGGKEIEKRLPWRWLWRTLIPASSFVLITSSIGLFGSAYVWVLQGGFGSPLPVELTEVFELVLVGLSGSLVGAFVFLFVLVTMWAFGQSPLSVELGNTPTDSALHPGSSPVPGAATPAAAETGAPTSVPADNQTGPASPAPTHGQTTPSTGEHRVGPELGVVGSVVVFTVVSLVERLSNRSQGARGE